jgi:hypothetical protein
MGQQGAEDIENRAPGQHGLDNLALLVGPRFGRGGRYARGGQPHVISRISPGRFSIDFCRATISGSISKQGARLPITGRVTAKRRSPLTRIMQRSWRIWRKSLI